MSLTFIGRKIGMAQVFDKKDGKRVVCTVIQAEPNTVLQIKKKNEKDGYNSIQLCGLPVKKTRNGTTRMSKPLLKRYEHLGIEACHEIRESRTDDVADFQVGQKITAEYFTGVTFVDVEGTSKGKGFQGVMKRHNFGGMAATHGNSLTHRHGGGYGMRTTPGRVFPGKKMPGRMGNERVTVQSLRLFAIEGDLLLVEGAVPGARNGVVFVRKAIKKARKG